MNSLKENTEIKGLSDMIVQNLGSVDYDPKEDPEETLKKVLKKIEEFSEESHWTRTREVVQDLRSIKRNASEDITEFITRFENLEMRLENTKIKLSNTTKAALLIETCSLDDNQISNTLARTDTDDERTILVQMKRKMKELNGQKRQHQEAFFTQRYEDQHPRRFNSRERYGSKSPSNRYGRHRSKSPEHKNSPWKRRRYDSNNHYKSPTRHNNQHKSPSRQQENSKNSSKSPVRTFKVQLGENKLFDRKKSIFENEVENCLLIDGGCPVMLAGEAWLETYEDFCEKKFPTVEGHGVFNFGDSQYETIKIVKIPIQIGEHIEETIVNIVETRIPLLLGRDKLSEWGIMIDHGKDEMKIGSDGKVLKMNRTEQGHLIYPLAKNINRNRDEIIKAVFQVRLDKEKQKYSETDLRKFHRTFGHPSHPRLVTLLQNADS